MPSVATTDHAHKHDHLMIAAAADALGLHAITTIYTETADAPSIQRRLWLQEPRQELYTADR
jgi:hypothetical protein